MERFLLAQLVCFGLAAALIYQVLSGSLRENVAVASWWKSGLVVALCLAPVIMEAWTEVAERSDAAMSTSTQIAFFVAISLVFAGAVALTYWLSRPEDESITWRITLPVSFISLILFLGSKQRFGYLSRILDDWLLDGNVFLRWAILGTFIIGLLLDVFVRFWRTKKGMALATRQFRDKMKRRRDNHLVIYEGAWLNRHLRFLMFDIQENLRYAGDLFKLVLREIGRQLVASLAAFMSPQALAIAATSLMVIIFLLLEETALSFVEWVATVPWEPSSSWSLALFWLIFVSVVQIVVVTIAWLAGIRLSEPQSAMTSVVVYVGTGAWVTALIATVAGNVLFLPQRGLTSIGPFFLLGVIVVLHAMWQLFSRRGARRAEGETA